MYVCPLLTGIDLLTFALAMHKAWPRLYRRITQNKASREEDKELVLASRIWFCLYLFEHQFVLILQPEALDLY